MTYLPRGYGPEAARIMVVGEAYGEQEETSGTPFVGYSGQELNRMLHEAGIMRSECYLTNLVNARPPYNDLSKWIAGRKSDVTKDHVLVRDKMCLPIVKQGYESLKLEISLVKPDLIIAFGNTAMWALTGRWGILKWRGSQLYSDIFPGMKVVPTIHPTAVLREYSLRPTAVLDLRRAARHRYPGPYTNIPAWNFIIRPSFQTVAETFDMLQARAEALPGDEKLLIEFDLETSPEHITCFGVSWSRTEAICVPITYKDGRDYWTEAEEGAIIHRFYKLSTHPKIAVRGQNLLYDCQHTYRWWHFVPNVVQDTMLSHHTCFAGMKKSLDFQSSMYCDYYEYWKEMHHDLSNKAGA